MAEETLRFIEQKLIFLLVYCLTVNYSQRARISSAEWET